MNNIDIHDEWGGIDAKIRSSVLGLNQHGIETTGSCEGDTTPCPWIMIKSSDLRIRSMLNELLVAFYSTRKVSSDVQIKIFPIGSRFYVYSGNQEVFAAWRAMVNETVELIARGEIPKSGKQMISPPEYQNEFQAFGEYLLSDKSHIQ